VIAKSLAPYRVGQQVRLNGGSFDGLIATIIEMDARDRLVLLNSILNQQVRLKVTAGNARAV
jgi:transcription antitermination factor NusG